jgi:hypothetical protein
VTERNWRQKKPITVDKMGGLSGAAFHSDTDGIFSLYNLLEQYEVRKRLQVVAWEESIHRVIYEM